MTILPRISPLSVCTLGSLACLACSSTDPQLSTANQTTVAGTGAQLGSSGRSAGTNPPPAGANAGTKAGAAAVSGAAEVTSVGGVAGLSGAPGAGTGTGGRAGLNAAPAGGQGAAGTIAGTSAPAAAAGGLAVAGAGAGGGAPPAAGTAGLPAAGSGATACATPAPGSQGKNPLFSDVYTADPGALVDGCTFYIHCGHDEGPNSFVLKEWYALSSTDMVHWNKQVALRLSDFAWADANAWAGQVVKKGAKYYWFAPVQERGGGMTIAVAVADSPTGPFHDAIGKPLINDAFEMSNAGFRTPSDTPFTIDPTVLVDDDGQAYLHYGGFGRMMVAKLRDDMVSIDGKLKEVTPQGFFEAPYLIKHAGTYYEIYAAGANPATIDYSTSDSPLGPWKYGGRVLDALPTLQGQDGATNHAAVAELAGQWYLVYHVSNGPNGGGTYKREVAVDKLTFRDDGTIPKVTPSAGLQF